MSPPGTAPDGRHPIRSRVWGPIIFLLLLRLITLFFIFPGARHGYTQDHISAAIGLLEGDGLTMTWSEMRYVAEHPSNISLNLDDVYFPLYRMPAAATLPLPSLVMAGVWTLAGTRSALAYLLFMILVEVAIVAGFLSMIRRIFPIRVMWILGLLLGLCLPLGRLVVSISYDAYAYYGSLLAFMAGLLLLTERRPGAMFWIGLGSAVTLLGREINLLLYPAVTLFGLWLGLRRRSRSLALRSVVYLTPFILVMGGAMVYRQITTGNPRPTRSMFWHSIWLGVGQFPNPYGLEYKDGSIWAYARKINPELTGEDIFANTPDSRHELTLKARTRDLIREHPWLLVRNFFLRVLIVVSPGFYQGGDSAPQRYAALVNWISPIGTALLAWGFWLVRRRSPAVLALCLLTLATMIVSFAWFYIVGRVILLAAHVYLIPVAVLLDHGWTRLRSRSSAAAGALPAALSPGRGPG